MDNLLKLLNSGEYEKIEGWCTKEKALRLASEIKPEFNVCVELGVFGGRSLLPIALMCNKTVIGIDAWNADASLAGTNDTANSEWWSKIDYNKMFKYTIDLMRRWKCEHVKLLRMKSRDAIVHFGDNSIDFLHQDSNHSEEISCEEVELYHKKVKVGGTWVFDDTNWPTTQKAQKMLESYGYEEIYDSGTWKIYYRRA